MTVENLVTLLTTAKFNVFLGKAPSGTACPYIVLRNVNHPNIAADNKVYQKVTELELRLVESDVHDWNLIKTLEDLLDGIPLYYESEDLYTPSEGVCEMSYRINFYGGIK